MNFFIVVISAATFFTNSALKDYSAREIFEKCRARSIPRHKATTALNFRFIQKVELKSRSGDEDDLTFRIIANHGNFERKLISTTVPNGDRFNGGYDAFDKMFLLSEYFTDAGKVLSSCEIEKPSCSDCYEIRFTYSNSSGKDDPLSEVVATMNSANYTPISIKESLKGLPLGVEFDNKVTVGYSPTLGIYYPKEVVMQVYAHFLFLKGEIAVVTIRNEDLQPI